MAGALTAPKRVALIGAAGTLIIIIAVMLEISSSARRAEFLAANTMTARAVAGYLSVVAPVDRGGSEYQLIAMLSAVHTLAASPRWHRGIQVAWGHSPLISDSLHLAPLDTATRRILADPGGTAVVERAGRRVALVPLLDRDLGYSIGWVAAWGMLAPEGRSPVSAGLLALIAVVGAPALVLPAALLANRTRWWLVIVASVGVMLLAVQENHRVRQLASRREAMVLGRVQQLVERAITMPRIDRKQLGRIETGPSLRETGWGRLEVKLAVGVGAFVLLMCVGAWSRTREHRLEKAEGAEDGTPLRS